MKAFFTAAMLTILYCVVTCSWLSMHAGVANFPAALYLTVDSQSVIWLSFFQFLVNNSFCPWIMIFRGRPSTEIMFEASYYFYGILDLSFGFNAANFSALCSCLAELLFGPAVGAGLLFLWVYVSHKFYTLAFAKLFNSSKQLSLVL